jgi:uncharacterized integral membrane protein
MLGRGEKSLMTSVMETPQEQRSGRRAALSIGVVVGVIVTVGVAALIAQNTNDVTVHWLTLDGQQPLWAVLVITAIAGVVLAKLFGFVWRHRDRKV